MFDKDWNTFIDLENYGQLENRSQILCIISTTDSHASRSMLSSAATASPATSASLTYSPEISDQSADASAATQLPSRNCTVWPNPFVFPRHKLSEIVLSALEKGTDLNNPKQRHVRGQFINTLVDEAIKYKSHPDRNEKVDMARCITDTWPFLREPIGRGYDGWLASIVDCLKAKRRSLGLIDVARADAIRSRQQKTSSMTGQKSNVTAEKSHPSTSYKRVARRRLNSHQQTSNEGSSSIGLTVNTCPVTSVSDSLGSISSSSTLLQNISENSELSSGVSCDANCNEQLDMAIGIEFKNLEYDAPSSEQEHFNKMVAVPGLSAQTNDRNTPSLTVQLPFDMMVGNGECSATYSEQAHQRKMAMVPGEPAEISDHTTKTLTVQPSGEKTVKNSKCDTSITEHEQQNNMTIMPDVPAGSNDQKMPTSTLKLSGDITIRTDDCDATCSVNEATHLEQQQEVMLPDELAERSAASTVSVAVHSVDGLDNSSNEQKQPIVSSLFPAGRCETSLATEGEASKQPLKRMARYSKKAKLDFQHASTADKDVDEEVHWLQQEWKKPERSRDMCKILSILNSTYTKRRSMIHAHMPTDQLKELFPALFSRQGLVQEYEQVTGLKHAMKIAENNLLSKSPKLVQMAKSLLKPDEEPSKKKVKKVPNKQGAIKSILSYLSVDNIGDIEEAHRRQAVAGIMLLPSVLGDNCSLFYKEYEAS